MKPAAIVLLVIGSLHMVGDIVGIRALVGLGAASAASPAPRVFCARQGLEAFSSEFSLEWRDHQGTTHQQALTPELYARLKGPYNRRNVFGAAIAGAPIMPAALRDPILSYALVGSAPLLREIGIDPQTIDGPISLVLHPKHEVPELTTRYEVIRHEQ